MDAGNTTDVALTNLNTRPDISAGYKQQSRPTHVSPARQCAVEILQAAG